MKLINLTGRLAVFIGIGIFWFLVVVAMTMAHFGPFDRRPLSYLGISAAAYLFRYAIIGQAIMLAYYSTYLRQYKPSLLFWLLYGLAVPLQCLTAVFPYQQNGRIGIVHWTAAGLVAIIIICLPLLFSLSGNLSLTLAFISNRITYIFFAVVPIEALLLIFLKQYALSEIINVLIFDAWLLIIALRPASK